MIKDNHTSVFVRSNYEGPSIHMGARHTTLNTNQHAGMSGCGYNINVHIFI